MCQRLVCQKRQFAARSSSCEVYRSEVHEIFMRIDTKHSYFSNYFIICLPSILSIVEVIIELFVVCQKLIMFMHNQGSSQIP